jgi:POT family proton-dependent oligopeptide transporter
MSSGGANVIDIAEVAKAEAPTIPIRLRPSAPEEEQKKLSLDADLTSSAPHDEDISEDDLKNLVRVAGPVPWQAYTIAFVEFCERFSYYGTTVVCRYFLPCTPPVHSY